MVTHLADLTLFLFGQIIHQRVDQLTHPHFHRWEGQVSEVLAQAVPQVLEVARADLEVQDQIGDVQKKFDNHTTFLLW